ncbi:MAG: hypothetical protein KBD63_01945 [Bacteriovoracaceae bacterium]|nr:hypothetical protein [Bacteriovoracaceae bacterium]
MIEIECTKSSDEKILGLKIFLKNKLVIGQNKGDILLLDPHSKNDHLILEVNSENNLVAYLHPEVTFVLLDGKRTTDNFSLKKDSKLSFLSYEFIIKKFSFEPQLDSELLLVNNLTQLVENNDPLLPLLEKIITVD